MGKKTEKNSIPKTAIIMFNTGAFGGAERKFSNLFLHLYNKYPDKIYYFINNHLSSHLKRIYDKFPYDNIRIVDIKNADKFNTSSEISEIPKKYSDIIPDPIELDRKTTLLRKIYWFWKNKSCQRNLYHIIEQYRSSLDIKVFLGIFSGVLPLVFYIKPEPRNAAVIFTDMDSWFSDVHSDMNKLWYRKYYSFNYALENADCIDFLSPYVLEGVRKRNVKLDDNRVTLCPCSFIDYSKCRVGEKKNFEIAFSARLEPNKNPLLFLEAAKEILKDYPDIKFYLLGEGSLVDEINNFILENGVEKNVNFTFHKNPPEVFAESSVFVSLQTGTNYPSQSVLEAMACSNAVVASNVGDTYLFINDSNGIKIQLNKQSLVSALRELINDRERTRKLGNAGRELALKEHTVEKFSGHFEELFNNAYKKVFGEG